MNKRSRLFLINLLGVLPLLIAFSAVAATQLQVNIPCQPQVPGISGCPPITGPASYIARVYQFALGAGGILALAVIVLGGVEYTLSAGSPSLQSDARDRILQALWGLLLLFGAYLILNTINPNLIILREP